MLRRKAISSRTLGYASSKTEFSSGSFRKTQGRLVLTAVFKLSNGKSHWAAVSNYLAEGSGEI